MFQSFGLVQDENDGEEDGEDITPMFSVSQEEIDSLRISQAERGFFSTDISEHADGEHRGTAPI